MRLLSGFLALLVFITCAQAWITKPQKPESKQPPFCTQPPFIGSCRPIIRPWYYDALEKRCKLLSAGFCSAGSNAFLTEKKCKEFCEQRSKLIPNTCLKAPVTEQCGQLSHAWYYDPGSKICKMFTYATGAACNNLANKFLTELKCQSVCIPKMKPEPICSQDPIPDRCFLRNKRWFFNFRNNTCMEFPKKGCGKGQNSFSTLEKCMNTCSYNRVTAACPTCEQKLQTEQRPLGKPGLPSQIGQLSPQVVSAQPSMPVQPGKPGQPGIGLPAQSGQPSRPGVGFPSQQGLPPINGGLAQPVQPSLMGRLGEVSPSNPGQSGNPSGNSVGLPGQPGLPPFSGGPGHLYQPDQTGRPSDSSANLLPNRPALSGQSNGHRVGLPSHNPPSILPTPNIRPGHFSRPALPVRPGYGSYGVPPTTTSQNGQRSPPRIDSPGLPVLPSVFGTSAQATTNPLPNYPTAPKPSVNLGMSLQHGFPAQNNQPLFSGSTGQPRAERQYRPYRSTNR